MKRVIVTGGRDFNDWVMVREVLEWLSPDVVIQGGAMGADRLAKTWAEAERAGCITVEANWDAHGRAAGPIRNAEMLDAYPDACVVAFPGGAGTEDCVKQARKRNMIVLRVEP